MALRAVYYNRVSTDDEDQLTSLANQKIESETVIDKNGWILVDGYIDEGKSGTTTKKRDEYNRLFQDMETDKFDIIVIKDQSRLMRNTKEWYLFIDRLVQNKKQLYFYLEQKFYTPDDALITGIKAILAEDYSRSLSKNINNSHRRRQASGSNIVITSKTWGYDKINKQVVINEEEAVMIKRIYDLALNNNYGSRTIAKVIEDEGYRNRKGGIIAEQVIRKIIRNPLYKGTAVMNIRHIDFETKQTIRNPESEWIYHENIVPAIIEPEIWDEVNEKMNSRSQIVITEGFKKKIIGSKKGNYELSGKIICGLCGESYWRATRKMRNGNNVYWCCHNYLARGRKTKNDRAPHGGKEEKYILNDSGCDNIHIKEVDLNELLYVIAKETYSKSNDDLVAEVMRILSQVIADNSDIINKETKLTEELIKVNTNREMLLDKYLEGIIAEDIYKVKEQKLINSASEIEQQLEDIKKRKQSIDNQQERLDAIKVEAKNIADKELSTHNLIKHIERIEVMPNELQITFDVFKKCRVSVNRLNYRKCEYAIITK